MPFKVQTTTGLSDDLACTSCQDITSKDRVIACHDQEQQQYMQEISELMLSDKIKEYSTRDKMLGTGSNNFYQDIVMHWPEYHQYQLKMAALSLVHISQMESIMKLLPHRFSVTSLLCITLFVFTAYL